MNSCRFDNMRDGVKSTRTKLTQVSCDRMRHKELKLNQQQKQINNNKINTCML